jgi:hypothetical protein
MILSKSKMDSFFLEDPKSEPIERELNNTNMKYFYFEDNLKLKTGNKEILNGCLLSGNVDLNYNNSNTQLNQFDIFFIPPNREITLKLTSQSDTNRKICINSYHIGKDIDLDIEIRLFDLKKFIPRGDHGSKEKMATYRTVWTAIKNNYFMSGYTNIPNESLKQGVITSVNLVKNETGNIEIYPHNHPDYPEVYIMCIDDDNYAITQYLINEEGQSISKDLKDGEGLFFSGNLGHSNFARPFYKNMKYCMYYWCIPTFGNVDLVDPITMKV